MITKDKVKIQDFRGKTNFDKKKTFYTKKKNWTSKMLHFESYVYWNLNHCDS